MKSIHVLAIGDALFWEEQKKYFPADVHLYGPHADAGHIGIYLHRAAVNATLPDVVLLESPFHRLLDDREVSSLLEQFALPVIIVNTEDDTFESPDHMAISMPITARNLRYTLENAMRLRTCQEENKILKEAGIKSGKAYAGRLERRVFGAQYKEAKRLYRLMVATIQQTREGVALINPQGEIEYVNSAFEDITGIRRRQLIGKHMKKCGGGRFAAALLLGVRKTVMASEPWHGKIHIHANLFDLYVGEIRDSARRLVGYAGIFFDITVKNEMEQRLVEAQRLEALGTFAGGIAHDFNNIIQAVQANIEVIRELFPLSAEADKYFNRVVAACGRADGLVRKFLNFSRNQPDEMTDVAIDATVQEVLELMRPTVPTGVQLSLSADPGTCTVKANPHSIYEVVMNLIRNAIDAFDHSSGNIDIRLDNAMLPPGNPFALPAGRYVKMVVADTGAGIPQEIAGRIFEPFFSTRQSGYGRGLGLAVVHGVVKSLNGHIGVKSIPGHGTEFYIYLPVQEEHAANGLGEHILLVCDNQAATAELRQIIASVGCRITTANSAQDALRLFASEPLHFDMVISEKICRDDFNQDMFERILALRETLPAIYIADYSQPIDIGIGALNRVVMLMRPFSAEVLAQAIRALFRYRLNSPIQLRE